MAFRVVRTNQYNQDLGLIHSKNGNHLESPNEGSSIYHQVTIHMHAQNITMFPSNETWYFTSQMLVSSSGGLILILTAQSTRNEFRMHRPYCTLTKTNWFLEVLSVIPKGSWGDVARRFTMIRWFWKLCRSVRSDRRSEFDEATVIGMNRMFIWTWARPRPIGPSTSRPPLHFHLTAAARRLAPPAAVHFLHGWTCSDHVDEEVPFVTNSSALLVQTDEGGVI
ncbi:hypothetical protein F511_14708 [Dorcoceras hygrometricum]|uniref:Uncharacterized protein n=1 Tax=Dorcoceras hygrometricum TaxID=472368 RepID=A0A2Z7BQY4_9LAMI|nr:hypothetical protein F511_14708 [Dorcoceras hygrometricum]